MYGGEEMTTPRPRSWQAKLGEIAPELLKNVTGLRVTVLIEGTL